MTINRLATSRIAKTAAVVAFGSLGLAACGSDPVPAEPASGGSGGGSSEANAAGLECPGGQLNAEGSSAQANAIAEAIVAYNAACGDKSTIEYNPTGSGAGTKSFYNGLVDFAGSDSALKSEEKDGVVETEKAKERCDGNEAWNLPMVVGPVAFAYNVDGLDKLTLDAETLAKIFAGKITKWNDPAIAALNDGASLPDESITVFFRSDESGTTENVTKFLKAAGKGAWTKDPGKAWTGTGEGKNKSSGVAQGVTNTKNSISYMEWSFARDNDLSIALLDNGNGPVELTGESVGKAVADAESKGSGNDLSLEVKYTDNSEGAYPALLVTYEIVCSKGLEAAKTALVKDFLTYFSSETAQQNLEEIGYAPLPPELATKVQTAVQAIE